jgi:LCP family protein required for cell wall assembly
MTHKHKEDFNVGKSLPNMLDEVNKKPAVKTRPLPEPKKRPSWKKALLGLFLVLLILVIASAGWLGWKFEKNCSKVFPDCTVFSLFNNSQLEGEETGRVNILLAGNSTDDPGHSGAQLTDSIMLVSLNVRDHSAYMLSIPRDLYVSYGTSGCPYGDAGKINAAYECGQALKFKEAGYPAGGMGLLEKIVSQNFDVPINYYALVNYSAFRDTVNAVGGIDVTINSPEGRLYDPNKDWSTGGPLVDLKNGKHHLDGREALDLARARGDPSPYGTPIGFAQSDYTRTANQRMMLGELKKKASSVNVLINPIKLGNLLDAVGKNVKTDFKGNNIHRLSNIVRSIPDSKLKSVSLNNIDGKGKTLLASYSSFNSGSALIPAAGISNYSQIQAYISRLNSQ